MKLNIAVLARNFQDFKRGVRDHAAWRTYAVGNNVRSGNINYIYVGQEHNLRGIRLDGCLRLEGWYLNNAYNNPVLMSELALLLQTWNRKEIP